MLYPTQITSEGRSKGSDTQRRPREKELGLGATLCCPIAIFKRLQLEQVALVGVADGIDTSTVDAKMALTFKSLMIEVYLDQRGELALAAAGVDRGRMEHERELRLRAGRGEQLRDAWLGTIPARECVWPQNGPTKKNAVSAFWANTAYSLS